MNDEDLGCDLGELTAWAHAHTCGGSRLQLMNPYNLIMAFP